MSKRGTGRCDLMRSAANVKVSLTDTRREHSQENITGAGSRAGDVLHQLHPPRPEQLHGRHADGIAPIVHLPEKRNEKVTP